MPSFVSFDALLTMILREQFRISFGDIKIAILELNEVRHLFQLENWVCHYGS